MKRLTALLLTCALFAAALTACAQHQQFCRPFPPLSGCLGAAHLSQAGVLSQ